MEWQDESRYFSVVAFGNMSVTECRVALSITFISAEGVFDCCGRETHKKKGREESDDLIDEFSESIRAATQRSYRNIRCSSYTRSDGNKLRDCLPRPSLIHTDTNYSIFCTS